MDVDSYRTTRRHTPENGILHSHSRENLESYTSWKNSSKSTEENVTVISEYTHSSFDEQYANEFLS
jgi:hypothetical protein